MSDASSELEITARTQIRRKPDRGHYDLATIRAILDEAFLCHVSVDLGSGPVIIPMAFGRVDDDIYLHGAAGNALLRAIARGSDLCVAVTLTDGLVLARSAFHHSMNYRSVVVFGTGVQVDDVDEKRRAVDAIVDHVIAGRSADARPPTDAELRATLVVRIAISEASAKVRTGGPIDDDDDLALPIWGGHIPLRMVADAPIADPDVPPGVAVPPYAIDYRRVSSV
jgi:nitroimidazol reductase NimA-like FMN-containing flavoprotein (pyridoxamine 5'-phosphate oxidase superfamily)